MSAPNRITVSRSKRGTTIKASGRFAQALFDALSAEIEKKPAQPAEAVARGVAAQAEQLGQADTGEAGRTD